MFWDKDKEITCKSEHLALDNLSDKDQLAQICLERDKSATEQIGVTVEKEAWLEARP